MCEDPLLRGRGINKINLRIGYLVSPNELKSCLLLTYTVREKSGKAGASLEVRIKLLV